MKNYEQIRAKNALDAANRLDFGGQEGGDVVKKIPTLIIDNGLLATCAFAEDKGEGHKNVFKAIIEHLADKDIGLLESEMKIEDFIRYLSNEVESDQLRQITAETMAYLNYLRRFAKDSK